ncbi:MAG: helicase-related protein [Beijerinckiaceae bacterium]
MNIPIPASHLHPLERAGGVRVLLGPTNTGKTHYAIERMLAHKSGMIGLPLRLLAREVYQRVVEKAGEDAVALVTGEEKIKPKAPRYWVSTVEAMPRDLDLAFVAVDEIQLSADLDRGHVFTDRLLNRRGRDETLLIGAATMQRAIEELVPGAPILSRPRLSTLSYSGDRKISRLPPRSAIVAFSVEEVYAIAEWIRRLRGGAAVVLGALSPRTRNAQVKMFQNGEVEYIVATDAIGMGLNLDVDHIAFASDRKFDGWQFRQLTPAEFGQIAGRAGRHMRDGTFGTTGRCPPFPPELVEALENHRFDPVTLLQWRNTQLDFSSLAALVRTLDRLPSERRLTRAPVSEDQMVLDIACRDENVVRQAKTPADVARLWETCQIPDYRKLSPAAHADLCLSIYRFIVRAGHIPEDWFARHLSQLDRMDGDLDTLSARIAQVRTWTFVANRSGWLRHPEHWQGVTRQVEDRLSDALHERLAQRFVDRRTSVLMRRLRENAMLEAEITPGGDVMVEGQHVGHLSGFVFSLIAQVAGEEAKTLQAAAQKALASEIEGRAKRVHEAVDESIVLANDGIVRWLGEAIGRIVPGEHVLEPRITVLAGEQLTGQSLELVQRRLDLWLAQYVKKLLGPLIEMEKGEGLEGVARGIAFQIGESLGVLDRSQVADIVKSLPQEARASLRKLGVRFGAYHLYLPALLKPAPRALAAQLWALKQAGLAGGTELAEVPHLAASGRTSFPADKNIPKGFYRAAGFRVCGERAVRVDILERLADLIRPAIGYRPGTTPGNPPPGTADGDGFVVTVNMTSLTGCSGESFATILRSLGYTSTSRQGPAITVPLLAAAPTAPVQPASATMPQPAADTAAEAETAPASDESPAAEIHAEETAAEHDDFELKQSNVAIETSEISDVFNNMIDSNNLELDARFGLGNLREPDFVEKAAQRPSFPHPAPKAAVADQVPLQAAQIAAAEAAPEVTALEAFAAEAAVFKTSATDLQESCAAAAVETEAFLSGSEPTLVSPRAEEAAGIAASEDAPPAPEAIAAAEVALIEIWRPQRQHHNQRRDHNRQRPNQRHDQRAGNGREAATGSSEAETSQGGGRNQARQGPSRRNFKLPLQARVSAEAQASSEPSAPVASETIAAQPREDRKDQRRDGPAGDGKPRQGRRNDERRDRRQGSFGSSEKPASRERQPDPNSPFAKLLILKQQWENQSNKT